MHLPQTHRIQSKKEYIRYVNKTLCADQELEALKTWTCSLLFDFASEICKQEEALLESTTVVESDIDVDNPPLEPGSRIICEQNLGWQEGYKPHQEGLSF